MIFLNNVQVTLPHIVFNTPFELIYDKRYPLHAKAKIFWFYTFSGYCLGSQIRGKKSYSETYYEWWFFRLTLIFQLKYSLSNFENQVLSKINVAFKFSNFHTTIGEFFL